jgi:hypothetical protein
MKLAMIGGSAHQHSGVSQVARSGTRLCCLCERTFHLQRLTHAAQHLVESQEDLDVIEHLLDQNYSASYFPPDYIQA